MEFAYSAHRASSLLVSRKREYLAIGQYLHTSTKTKSVKSLDFSRVLALLCFSIFAVKHHKNHSDHITDHNGTIYAISQTKFHHSIFLMIPVATPWMRRFARSSPRITIGCIESFSGQRYIASSDCLYLLSVVCLLS